jgi:hypothetical protein
LPYSISDGGSVVGSTYLAVVVVVATQGEVHAKNSIKLYTSSYLEGSEYFRPYGKIFRLLSPEYFPRDIGNIPKVNSSIVAQYLRNYAG